MKEPVLAIVGVCAAGKTTLAAGLTREGIRAYAVPQEHSFVRRLWEKQHPEANLLVMLDAQWETTVKRRPTIAYGPERLAEQHMRLQPAREAADLYLPTDELSVDQVRERVLEFVQAWKERV